MKYHIGLCLLVLTGCTPAEVAVVEELTNEALILEKTVLESPPEPREQIAGT